MHELGKKKLAKCTLIFEMPAYENKNESYFKQLAN